MTIDLPPLKDAARDPDTYIPKLVEMQEQAKKDLQGISYVLRNLRKIKASTEELEFFEQHGIPRPREAEHDAAARGLGDQERLSPGEEGSRRERVLQLLGQDPDREWTIRDIGTALEIDNLKSLRVSMDGYVRSGHLEKRSVGTSSLYRVGKKGYQETL